MRLLADMENLRDRTNRQAEQARSFAIQVHLCHTLSPKYSRLYRPAFMSVVIPISHAEMHAVRCGTICWLQGFVKSLLDVADNLERAAGSVTDESLKGLGSDGEPLTAEQSSKLHNGLLEGVHLTDRILVQASLQHMHFTIWITLLVMTCSLLWKQALKQNGVEKFSPLGQKFDPNMHSALFQIPDAEKEAGTVVIVTKVGLLHSTVLCQG